MSKEQINPIDDDHITENPHSLEYPHHRGSIVVKPEDRGKQKGLALSAMEQQTDQQLLLIKEQMELLAAQAQKIQRRKEVSEFIYQAEIRFTPIIAHSYFLYQRDNGRHLLSMIAPNQWGRKGCEYEFVSKVTLLADRTWDVDEQYNV